MKNKTEISKYIALILRHKPETIGIKLDEHGWANVEELIKGINVQYSFSKDDLEEIVSTDNKQRYSFNDDKTLIRANQGHSISVDVELKKVTPPDILCMEPQKNMCTLLNEKACFQCLDYMFIYQTIWILQKKLVQDMEK